MDFNRSNIRVLVVDHDDVSLALLANMLMAWKYKARTAKDAHHALVTLRNSQGSFDLIISEFHILGMNGFKFQKQIQDEFQLPVIMMSKDNRLDFISMTLEHGAVHYIVKPFCAEDFRDIWKYALEAKKNKLFIDSLLVKSQEPKTISKYCKRKSSSDEYHQGEEEIEVVKKPKLVWTDYLHNRFLLAIKQIGFGKVEPKKILEIMNIPNLTRENVSSHLQKYRIFLRELEGKGMHGEITDRALRSTFASELPIPLINEIQQRRKTKLRLPTRRCLKTFPYQGSMTSSSSYSNLFSRDLKFGDTSYQNHCSIRNDSLNHVNYGVKDWNFVSMRSSNILPHNVTFDGINNNPFGIQTNNSPVAIGIRNMIKGGINNVSITDASSNRNSFGFNIREQNSNVNFGSLVNEKFDLVQGGFDLDSVSDDRGVGGSGFHATLVNERNIYENSGFPLQKLKGKVVENEEEYNGANFTNKVEFNQMEFNISDSWMANDMNLHNELNEDYDASGYLKSDMFCSFQDVQPLEQLHKDGDNIYPQAGNASCVLNELPICSNQNPKQYGGNEGFSNGEPSDRLMGDKFSNASTSTSHQEFDMDLVEAFLFGTIED